MHRARRVLWIVAVPAGAVAMACSSNVAGTISLVTGYEEADPFAEAPVPTAIQISAIADDGGVTVLAQSALPVTANLSLPTQSTNTTASLVAAASDDAGATVLWGQTLPIEFSSLEGLTLPMFVQRTGELTRLPVPFPAAPSAPLVTILDGRFLLSIDGPGGADPSAAQTSTQLYDLLTWSPFTSSPALPVAPVALATVGTQVLLINGANSVWYDFSDTSTSTPSFVGGSLTGVTGGVAVTDPMTGDSYVVVGAAASGGASSVILYVNASLQLAGSPSLSVASLGVAREGAAAAWVSGQLVIAGGSAQFPGVEVLPAGNLSTHQLTYPADPTVGAGATALDQTHVLLAGGVTPSGKDPGARVIDITSCPATGCAATPWTAPIAPPLVSAQAFTIDPGTAFVVGNDASNNTHAWILTPTSSKEINFKVPRKGATALALPMPINIPIMANTPPIYPVAVVGGDVTVESFPPFVP